MVDLKKGGYDPLTSYAYIWCEGGRGCARGQGGDLYTGGLVFTVLPEVLVFQFSLIFRNSPIFSYFSWKIW